MPVEAFSETLVAKDASADTDPLHKPYGCGGKT
jgi:hypothetical protein